MFEEVIMRVHFWCSILLMCAVKSVLLYTQGVLLCSAQCEIQEIQHWTL